MKKKILVLFCGGTIVMQKDREGALRPPSDQKIALYSLLELEPRLMDAVQIDLHFIANIDSTNIIPDLWDQMAQVIYDHYEDYEGFVVTHGTDTMAYSASALSFALQNLGKPVVFTGAQLPGHEIASDARSNFVNAVRAALLNIAAVVVVFAERVILGVRASKVSHSHLDAFRSINQPSIGNIGVQVDLTENVAKRHARSVKLQTGFDSKIAVISLVPGMPISILDELLDCDLHGIVLVAYGNGNIPEIYLPFLQKAKEKKLPVVIRSQCLEGSMSLDVYASGKQALQFNVIEAYDMSLEATITKLMWALKHGVGYDGIKSIIQKNYAGEISL
jgi:L-asparaginase